MQWSVHGEVFLEAHLNRDKVGTRIFQVQADKNPPALSDVAISACHTAHTVSKSAKTKRPLETMVNEKKASLQQHRIQFGAWYRKQSARDRPLRFPTRIATNGQGQRRGEEESMTRSAEALLILWTDVRFDLAGIKL